MPLPELNSFTELHRPAMYSNLTLKAKALTNLRETGCYFEISLLIMFSQFFKSLGMLIFQRSKGLYKKQTGYDTAFLFL